MHNCPTYRANCNLQLIALPLVYTSALKLGKIIIARVSCLLNTLEKATNHEMLAQHKCSVFAIHVWYVHCSHCFKLFSKWDYATPCLLMSVLKMSSSVLSKVDPLIKQVYFLLIAAVLSAFVTKYIDRVTNKSTSRQEMINKLEQHWQEQSSVHQPLSTKSCIFFSVGE